MEGIQDIVNSAIEEGVEDIINNHKRFRNHGNFLLTHIDKSRLKKEANKLYNLAKNKGLSDQEQMKYIHSNLTDYVSSGGAFDDFAQTKILKVGLKQQAKKGLFGIIARNKLNKEDKFDNILAAGQELYQLFKSGEYSDKLKDVGKAAKVLNDMHYLDNMAEILEEYGVAEGKYNFMKKQMRSLAEYEHKQIIIGMENYLTQQNMAASILAILGGIFLTFFGMQGITGNVIGNSTIFEDFIGVIIGIFLLALAFLLFRKISKKSKKLKISKKLKKKR